MVKGQGLVAFVAQFQPRVVAVQRLGRETKIVAGPALNGPQPPLRPGFGHGHADGDAARDDQFGGQRIWPGDAVPPADLDTDRRVVGQAMENCGI